MNSFRMNIPVRLYVQLEPILLQRFRSLIVYASFRFTVSAIDLHNGLYTNTLNADISRTPYVFWNINDIVPHPKTAEERLVPFDTPLTANLYSSGAGGELDYLAQVAGMFRPSQRFGRYVYTNEDVVFQSTDTGDVYTLRFAELG